MGFKQVFDNLTVKHMDALRKLIQSRRLCFEPLFLDLSNVKEILRMIARKIYVRSCIWFALISTRGMTLDKLLLPPSSGFLQYQ